MTAARVRNFPQFATATQDERARLFAVSRETVQFADKVLDSGDEELIAQVDAAEFAVSRAAKSLRPKPSRPTNPPPTKDDPHRSLSRRLPRRRSWVSS